MLDGRDHIDDFRGMKLILKGTDYTIQFAENSDQGTFTINTEKSPKWIDIKTSAKGPFLGKTLWESTSSKVRSSPSACTPTARRGPKSSRLR